MNEKFTPGPWFWDAGLVPPDSPERYADIYTEGADTIIARFNDFIPEGRANAQLMIAAPDLLAALQRLLAQPNIMWVSQASQIAAKTAIAKATVAIGSPACQPRGK